jgi:hypothetical protein
MPAKTRAFKFVLVVLLAQLLAGYPQWSKAESDKIVRHVLCEQALVEGSSLGLAEVLAQGGMRKTIWVAPLNTEIDLLLLHGVYPPYYYGHSLLEMAVRRLKGTERLLILGVGSGYDATVLKKRFPKLSIEAVDINSKAVINTELNLAFHGIQDVKVYRSDLFNDVKGKFDVILFHAPRSMETPLGVVPEPGDETRFDLGGIINRRFLTELPSRLNKRGVALIMTDAETKFDSGLNPRRLTTGSWDRFAPAKGSFGIFSLSP